MTHYMKTIACQLLLIFGSLQAMHAEEAVSQEKKIVYITPGQWGDLFDLGNIYYNRDGCLEPLCKLRDTAAKAGYEIRQAPSVENLGNFEYLLVFEVFLPQLKELEKYPKEKLVLFLWEPPSVMPENYQVENHQHFGKVYTWHDDLVDNKKYFKLYYPIMHPMIKDVVDFDSKKLVTLIAGNKNSAHENQLYGERRKAIIFYEKNHLADFDLYGRGWPAVLKSYKGAIAPKVDTLKNYKFCLTYENIQNVPGYVTEKIFDGFHAGSVPIYWGASNITQYVPKECFIARQDFTSDEELYQFMKNMPKDKYEIYIANIRKYLESPQAQLFSHDHFVKTIMDLITVPPKKEMPKS